MITFNPISNKKYWAGDDWTITDEEQLAKLVAKVALGQARHVVKILQETGCIDYAPSPSAVDGAIRLLTAADPKKPWHRDGWLFQVLAWIAAHLHSPDTLKAAPHMIHAHKGFDGVQLRLDSSNGTVLSVVICEQKATGNPRNLITSQVWPEFQSLETGRRDNELVAEVATILERNGHVDVDQAVSTIIWQNSRSYCVAITVGDDEHSDDGRKALFKGYKKVVPARDVVCRRAETLYQADLRKWMNSLAERAINAVHEMEAENV
ncbi:MAG: hypothetical protein ABL311_13915 [Nitratireductor rhodophyticola]|uniref:hypothetical protein n=1 Tax=Nitratireductor rhodophyticola TaxID=2854036 RepID=UPI0032D8B9F3